MSGIISDGSLRSSAAESSSSALSFVIELSLEPYILLLVIISLFNIMQPTISANHKCKASLPLIVGVISEMPEKQPVQILFVKS